MLTVNHRSLGAMVDSVSESLFFARKVSAARTRTAARWIAQRQGLPGSYAGMFAPTAADARGFRLFSGEVVRSRIGAAHVLGEECCRVLALLPVPDPRVEAALQRAVAGMAARLDETERLGFSTGTYCCGTCSVAYWRNLALRLFARAEDRLRLGMQALQQARRGDGRWRRFPFFYTSLALTEIGPELAGSEITYAAAAWRRILPRLSRRRDALARRRAAIGRRLLELCETPP